MAAVLKCPRCGRLCRVGVVPFPRCARCHEHLLKCRYCARFDERMLDCTSEYRDPDFRISDPDLYLACPYHKTTIAVNVERAVRRRVWVPALGLVVVAVLAALMVERTIRRPPTDAAQLHARLLPIEVAYLHDPLTMTIQIWNAGPGRAEQVVLRLDRSYERYVKLDDVTPEPTQRIRTPETYALWFPELASGGTLNVNLEVTPHRRGRMHFIADAMSPGGGQQDRIVVNVELSP